MVFPQILSHMPLLSGQLLLRYVNYPCVISCDNILGGSRLKNDGNPLITNFQQVSDHLPGFENYTFFDFQKNCFSLHPRVHLHLPLSLRILLSCSFGQWRLVAEKTRDVASDKFWQAYFTVVIPTRITETLNLRCSELKRCSRKIEVLQHFCLNFVSSVYTAVGVVV